MVLKADKVEKIVQREWNIKTKPTKSSSVKAEKLILGSIKEHYNTIRKDNKKLINKTESSGEPIGKELFLRSNYRWTHSNIAKR